MGKTKEQAIQEAGSIYAHWLSTQQISVDFQESAA